MNPSIKEKLERMLPALPKRPRAVLKALLKRGSVSTYELGRLGYDQPPRAAQDLKENGVRLKKTSGKHPKSGSRMAIYWLDDDQPFLGKRFSGRASLPKAFRTKILDLYGPVCCVCARPYSESLLQIDHRVPYGVAGEVVEPAESDFMPLCASHQRTKSWVCEHCPNYLTKNVAVCETCFWAKPDGEYQHVATIVERRLDLVWRGPEEMAWFDQLKLAAGRAGVPLAQYVTGLLMKSLAPVHRRPIRGRT